MKPGPTCAIGRRSSQGLWRCPKKRTLDSAPRNPVLSSGVFAFCGVSPRGRKLARFASRRRLRARSRGARRASWTFDSAPRVARGRLQTILNGILLRLRLATIQKRNARDPSHCWVISKRRVAPGSEATPLPCVRTIDRLTTGLPTFSPRFPPAPPAATRSSSSSAHAQRQRRYPTQG